MFEDGRTQLVLKPESPHDIAVCNQMAKLPNTYRADFDRTRGGWTQDLYAPDPYWRGSHDDNKDVVIVFDHAREAQAGGGQ